MFKHKFLIKDIITDCEVDKNVYNGKRKFPCDNFNFMTPENISSTIKTLKMLTFDYFLMGIQFHVKTFQRIRETHLLCQ